MGTRTTARTKIGDCEYVLQLMDGDRALTRFGTLAKFLGGPLGRLLGSAKSENAPELVAAAMSELGEHLASEDFRELVYDALRGSAVQPPGKAPLQPLITEDGNREIFKGHFTGDFGALIALAWFAIKENFGGFLSKIPALDGLLKAARAKAQLQLLRSQEDTIGASPG